MSDDTKFPPDPKDQINLGDLLQTVIQDSVEEKKKEARVKINFVMNGMREAMSRIKKAKDQIVKDEERLKKAKEKIDRINSGDWNVLNSINVNEKDQNEGESK